MLHSLPFVFPQSHGRASPPPPCFVRTAGCAPLSLLNEPAVAIVGARRGRLGPGPAYEFGAEAALCGFLVVSGLALGCDAAAHLGCLSVGGTTAAVLPCGVDRIVPVSNSTLGENILASGGCLVSQYPPGTPPRPFRFVERNRVIAALSRAVIVMEADMKSGSLHTARFAFKNKTPLACYIPANQPLSSGCRLLLEKHGAVALHSTRDLRSFLANLKGEQP